jgi:hypothetical protein
VVYASYGVKTLLDRFAQGADRLQPALNIEKALLPHDPLAPSAHDRMRSRSQIRGDLARGIFRGAFKSKDGQGARPRRADDITRQEVIE